MENQYDIDGAMRADAVWSCASKGRYSHLWRTLAIALLIYLLLGIYRPALLISIPLSLASLLIIVSSSLRVLGIFSPQPKAPQPVDDRRDSWPRYTVLVPIYDEAHMVAPLMANLSLLDYPRDKLQILMICEADDAGTVQAVKHHLKAPFELVCVPPGKPRTKPKAMNVAMKNARGELVTIYDAEDRPHPLQLKSAVRMLEKHPEWAAVQAPLGYYNWDQNWLTRQFTLEYASLFHFINPLFVRLGLPFPLGGTSNHFRRSALEQVGGWDPHNVTEDADLSFRFVAKGWKVGMMDHTTLEEAVSEPHNWVYQRTRWIKGFMQSWAVHMREPLRYGWRRALALQLSLGLTILAAFLHVPAVIAVTLYAITSGAGLTDWPTAPWAYWVAGYGYTGPLLAGVIAAKRANRLTLIPQVILMPFYWMLLFIPALAAARQIVKEPFKWNKTRHGDARISQTAPGDASPLLDELHNS